MADLYSVLNISKDASQAEVCVFNNSSRQHQLQLHPLARALHEFNINSAHCQGLTILL